MPLPNVKKFLKPTPTNLLIGSGIAITGYILYQYMTNGSLKLLPEDDKVAGPPPSPATRVYFSVYPTVARPDGMVTITGYFADFNNNRITVPEAYYYVINPNAFYGRQVVMTGSLGTNVAEFTKLIKLPQVGNGSYTVLVSDHALNDTELGAQNFSQGAGGIGSRGRTASDPISLTDKSDLSYV